jgi:hypothetical protein
MFDIMKEQESNYKSGKNPKGMSLHLDHPLDDIGSVKTMISNDFNSFVVATPKESHMVEKFSTNHSL